jgi:hypothetical protein
VGKALGRLTKLSCAADDDEMVSNVLHCRMVGVVLHVVWVAEERKEALRCCARAKDKQPAASAELRLKRGRHASSTTTYINDGTTKQLGNTWMGL